MQPVLKELERRARSVTEDVSLVYGKEHIIILHAKDNIRMVYHSFYEYNGRFNRGSVECWRRRFLYSRISSYMEDADNDGQRIALCKDDNWNQPTMTNTEIDESDKDMTRGTEDDEPTGVLAVSF